MAQECVAFGHRSPVVSRRSLATDDRRLASGVWRPSLGLQCERHSRRVQKLELVDEPSDSFHAPYRGNHIIELVAKSDSTQCHFIVVRENLDSPAMLDTMIELCCHSRCKPVIRGDCIGSHVSHSRWLGRPNAAIVCSPLNASRVPWLQIAAGRILWGLIRKGHDQPPPPASLRNNPRDSLRLRPDR